MNVDGETWSELLRQLSIIAASSVRIPTVIPEGLANIQIYKSLEAFRMVVFTNNGLPNMTQDFDRLVVPYVNDNPYVFSNYLMYEIYSAKFPNKVDNFVEGYKGLAGELLTLLILTAGMCRENDKLGDDDIVNAAYLFHRGLSHELKCRERLGEQLEFCNLGIIWGAFGL